MSRKFLHKFAAAAQTHAATREKDVSSSGKKGLLLRGVPLKVMGSLSDL